MDNNPKKVLSKRSVRIRKMISPVFRFFIPMATPNSKLTVCYRAAIPKQPVIFAATHGFREDVEHTLIIADRQAYILVGSLKQMFCSVDGITSWLAGMILVDRTDKESRAAAKKKMVYALKLGASIIMYPEGTWNKSPNQLVSGLFSGIYDVAKESGALVVPIATYRNGNHSYGMRGEAFDITAFEREKGMMMLRDKMATMQYEMMEKYGQCKRADLPYGKAAEDYWEKHINKLMAEVKFYEYEVEMHTQYREKNVVSPQDAFSFIGKLEPNCRNAFLFRKRNI